MTIMTKKLKEDILFHALKGKALSILKIKKIGLRIQVIETRNTYVKLRVVLTDQKGNDLAKLTPAEDVSLAPGTDLTVLNIENAFNITIS